MALSGCLTPPPIEEEPQSESAPVVDDTQVRPAASLVEFELGTNPNEEFSVAGAVSDPDGDLIYYYWYLLEEQGQTGVEPIRSNTTTFRFIPCTDRPDLVEGFLYLELDISDRPRSRGPDGEELEEPRTYPEDANVVTLDWVLHFVESCGGA